MGVFRQFKSSPWKGKLRKDRAGFQRFNKSIAHPTTAYRFSEVDKCFHFACIFAPNEKTNPKPPAKYLARIRRVLYEVKEVDAPIHACNAPVAAHTYKCIDIYKGLRTPSTTDILGKNEDTKHTVANDFRELYPGKASGKGGLFQWTLRVASTSCCLPPCPS